MNNCFVYKWTEKSTNIWYIGSRTAKGCNVNDGYICSSKYVKPLISANPDNWIREILETGSNKEMLKLEHELLTCLDAEKSNFSYNRTNGNGIFSMSGKKIKRSTEHQAKIVLAKKDYKHSVETLEKMSKNISGVPKTGKKAKGVSSGPATGQRAKGVPATGKHAKGIPQGPATGKNIKGHAKPKSECPHCNLFIDATNMIRWHFDKCKKRIL